jgi:hypothetical protein
VSAPLAPASGATSSRELRVAIIQEPGTLNPVVANLAIETDFMQLILAASSATTSAASRSKSTNFRTT